MLLKSLFHATLLSLFLLCFSASAADAGPTIQQVYDAAKAGKMEEAQAMMQKVLQEHPNSGKAHFVQAELLAKQGRYASAQAELNNADRLTPGLPFAKPEAIENLRRAINSGQRRPAANMAKPAYAQPSAPANSGTPWGLIIVGIGLIGFIILAVKFMANRNPPTQYYGGPGAGPAGPMQPYNGGGAPGQMMGGSGSSMGSGIVGGLVTGAALGAGMVAGQELMHHFTDGNRGRENLADRNDNPPQNDMGGNDFGLNDNSSWDDGGSSFGGGGDDW